jgi:large subunit ribosomal protein L24
MIAKCHIRKDDKVRVIAGKDGGKIGKVLKINRKKGRVLVENVNIVKRHSRPTAANKQGGIVESESAIHLSNVMLMCGKCAKAVRVRFKSLEDDKKVRICGKCGEIIE